MTFFKLMPIEDVPKKKNNTALDLLQNSKKSRNVAHTVVYIIRCRHFLAVRAVK